MQIDIPKEEIESDLNATERDIARLDAISENLRAFISDSMEEDRSFLRTDLLKYDALAAEARALRTKIRFALSSHKN